MITADEWDWFGQAGHFCEAHRCRFHLHTHVGGYCISTVGELFVDDGQEYIGGNYFYESMVFRLSCPEDNWREVDADRYHTREQANLGHLKLCTKYGGLT